MGIFFSKRDQLPPKRCSFLNSPHSRHRSHSSSENRSSDDEKHFSDRPVFDLPEKWPFSPVVSWLKDCRSTHRFCAQGTATPVSGLRLIDCDTHEIVEAPPQPLFAALSYVWGKSESTSAPNQGHLSRLPTPLPLLISDAIVVAKALGFPYLWVDKYCIDQSNPNTKYHQMQQMDLIYRKAELAIAAAAGSDQNYGLPGVTSRRRKQLILRSRTRLRRSSLPTSSTFDGISSFHNGCLQTTSTLEDVQDAILESTYSKRGWTYQEASLSRRRLVFTKEQVYFECAEGICRCETETNGNLGISTPGGIFSRLQPDPSATLDVNLFKLLLSWDEYSKRVLSFESDALNAFAGMTRWWQSISPHFHHLAGVYFLLKAKTWWYKEWDDIAEHLQRHSFVYALSWAHKHSAWEAPKQRPRRRIGFPSWSPAGWIGESSFSWWNTVKANNFEAYADNIVVEVEGGLKLPYQTLFKSLPAQDRNTLIPKALFLDSIAVPAHLVRKCFSDYKTLEWLFCEDIPARVSFSDGAEDPCDFIKMLNKGELKLIVLGGDGDTVLPSREYSLLLVLAWRNGFWSRNGVMRVECSLSKLLDTLGENNVDRSRRSTFRLE